MILLWIILMGTRRYQSKNMLEEMVEMVDLADYHLNWSTEAAVCTVQPGQHGRGAVVDDSMLLISWPRSPYPFIDWWSPIFHGVQPELLFVKSRFQMVKTCQKEKQTSSIQTGFIDWIRKIVVKSVRAEPDKNGKASSGNHVVCWTIRYTKRLPVARMGFTYQMIW